MHTSLNSNGYETNIAERAYTLNFLKANPSIEEDPQKWNWTPAKADSPYMPHMLKTATFSGQNQADDYQNE